MFCKISNDINKNSYSNEVTDYGALVITDSLDYSQKFDEELFQMTSDSLSNSDIKNLHEFEGDEFFLKSYFFTNNNEMDATRYPKSIKEDSFIKFKKRFNYSPDSYMFINKIFKNQKKLKSTNINNTASQLILEGRNFNSKLDYDRSYINLDRDILRSFRKKTADEGDGDLYNEYLEMFIISALQRGYSITTDSILPGDVVNKAVNKYKAINTKKVVNHASEFQQADEKFSIIKITNANTYSSTADTKYNNTSVNVWSLNKNIKILDSILSDEDLMLSNKFKEIPLNSKAYVAMNIAKAFKKFIPNLKISMLSSVEIMEKYNATFANKSGFIIDNEIVINLSLFDPSTMFHELGHYYMKWLTEYNPDLKTKILEEITSKFPSEIVNFTKIYKSTGISFSKDEILEEVFVTNLGLNAFKQLDKIIDLDAIRTAPKTKKDISKYPKKVLNSKGKEIAKKADVYYLNPANTDNIDHTEFVQMFNLPTSTNAHYVSMFQPLTMESVDDTADEAYRFTVAFVGKKAIKVGPYKDLSDVELLKPENRDKYEANIDEAVKAYEYFLLNGIDKYMIEKYKIDSVTLKALNDQHAYILNTLGTDSFNRSFLENVDYKNMYGFADTLLDFNTQYLREQIEGLKNKENITNAFEHDGKLVETDFPLGSEQETALKRSIEHITSLTRQSSFTIQGSAGTGKTSIIKFLDNYLNTNITYAAPTHSAIITLAEALVSAKINDFPITVQSMLTAKNDVGYRFFRSRTSSTRANGSYIIDESSMIDSDTVFWLKFNYGGFKREEVDALTEKYKKFFFIPADTNAKSTQDPNALVLRRFDSSETTIDGEKMLYVDTYRPDVKTIFLGDIAQLPPVKGESKISSSFETTNKVILEKIYRQDPNNLLVVLNKIKKNKSLKTYKIENGDGSIKYIEDETTLYSDFLKRARKDRSSVSFLSFTNKTVEAFNRKIKTSIDGDLNIIAGDTILGYIGGGGKNVVNTNRGTAGQSLANSVSYKVQSVKNREFRAYTKVPGALPILFNVIELESISPILTKIGKNGVYDIKNKVVTKVIPLFTDDNILTSNITKEMLNKNKLSLVEYFKSRVESLKVDNEKSRNSIVREFFYNTDISRDIIVDLTNTEVLLNTSDNIKSMDRSGSDYITLQKGIDYNYAMTIHKSQGKTIKYPIIDLDSIVDANNSPIYNEAGEKVNSFSNILQYTALSRASIQATLYSEKDNYDNTGSIESLGLNKSPSKQLTKDVGESIGAFTETFVKNLLGVATLNIKTAERIKLPFNMIDLINFSYEDGTINNTMIDVNNMGEVISNIKNFSIDRASIKEVANGLFNRGFIKISPSGFLILYDENNNMVNNNGEIINKPTTIKYKKGPKVLKLIKGYLSKYQDFATVLYDVGATNITTVQKLVQESSKIKQVPNTYKFSLNGTPLKGATTITNNEFSSEFDQEQSIKKSIFYSTLAEFKKANLINGMTDDEAENDAINRSEKYVTEEGPGYTLESGRIKSIYSFKRVEGTYLHNINEFFVMALNYSQKIDYNTEKEKIGHTYFLKHIRDAILSSDKNKFKGFFNDFFFNRLQGETQTEEYKQFKEVYSFLLNNITTEDIPSITLLLDRLINVLEEKVYKEFKGPLTLLPEFRIANEAMGMVGIIDLLVIDGDGAAHIIDYKTKESRKFGNWNYSAGGVRMKGVMSSYYDNALMHASIQTSMYKIALQAMGIQVKTTSVFYIEADIKGGDADSAFNDSEKMRYNVTRIFKTPVVDVSAYVLEFYRDKNIDILEEKENNSASEITGLVSKASGGRNIDTPRDVTATATRIYEKAIGSNSNLSEADKAINKILGNIISGASEKGLKVILTGGVITYIPKEIRGEEDIIAYIEDLLLTRKDVAFVEADLELVFYSLDRNTKDVAPMLGTIDKEKAIRGLLNGTDPATYEFMKFSSDVNYGTDFNGVSFLKNKITGEVRVISLNVDYKTTISFREGYSNILGNYISNNLIKSKYPNLAGWENNNYNMRLLKVGLMIVRAKQLDPDFKVSMVLMNKEMGSSAYPTKIDMVQLMEATKALLTEAKNAGEVLPDIFANALDDYDLFNPSNYTPNPTISLGEYLDTLIAKPNIFYEVFTTAKGKERAKKVNDIIKNYDPTINYQDLLDALQELKHTLGRRLTTQDAKLDSDLWMAVNNSILFLMGFNYTISPKNTNYFQKFFFTPSSVSNTYMSTYNRKITDSNVAARGDFINYKNEYNHLIQKLAESKGVNLSALGSSLYKSSLKGIFASLYVDEGNTDRTKAFILKKPSQVSSQAEKDIIRFINKTLQDFSQKSIFRKIDLKEGWIPLIKKSSLSMRADTDLLDQARKIVDFTAKDPSFNDDIGATNNMEKEFDISNSFDNQVPAPGDTSADQFTKQRRFILGIDEFGNTLEDARNINTIEDNLENILDAFVAASLNTIHYKDVSSFGLSLFYNILQDTKLTGKVYDSLTDVLTIIQKKNIQNKESDQRIPGLNTVNKVATAAVVAGSVTQILLEAFTNPLITFDNYMSDKLYGLMFGGQREFSMASYNKAIGMMVNPYSKDRKLLEAIDLFYGFSNSDSKELQKVLKSLEGNSLFQHEKLMWVNKTILESWQKITLAAYMIEQGSFYAHTLDKYGNLVYDQSKDKRFFGGKSNAEDKLYKNKAYEQTKFKMLTERGGLTEDVSVPFEDRKLKKAYTNFDINYLKEMLVELYSSMDNSSKSLSIYYTWMSFITKMRTWLFAKMSRYFTKPITGFENESMSRLQRVKDANAEGGYRLEWVGQPAEGIVYSLLGIGRLFSEYKFDMFKNGSVTNLQKKNLSKLMADMIVGMGLAAAATGLFKHALDDKQQKDKINILIRDRFLMATGDAFLIKSLLDTVSGNGSMFIAVSIAARAFTNGLSTIYVGGQYIMDPGSVDSVDVLDSVRKTVGGVYGPVKTVNIFYESYLEE